MFDTQQVSQFLGDSVQEGLAAVSQDLAGATHRVGSHTVLSKSTWAVLRLFSLAKAKASEYLVR